MKLVVIAALAAMLGNAAPALASARLAEQKQCMQCHAVGKDTVGPSFRTIRAIYRKERNAQAKMVAVIRDGSAAHFGPLRGQARMPDASERPPVSEREARQLARWIMQGAPASKSAPAAK